MIALNKRMTIISVVTQILLLERHQKKIKSLGEFLQDTTDKGIISRLYKDLKLIIKNQITQLKMGKGSE